MNTIVANQPQLKQALVDWANFNKVAGVSAGKGFMALSSTLAVIGL